MITMLNASIYEFLPKKFNSTIIDSNEFLTYWGKINLINQVLVYMQEHPVVQVLLGQSVS